MKSVFIYNPASGKGRLGKHRDFIIKKLGEKYGDIEWVETDHIGHAFELAQKFGETYDYIFASGGDGTLNEVINGISQNEHRPIIGYIPSGTVNDVARSLGLSKNVKKAVKILVAGNTFEHDTFNVNGKFGIYVCCAGLFSKTSYETKRYEKKIFGKLAYLTNGIKEIFKAKSLPVQIQTDDERIKENSALILITNSRSVAGFRVNKKAKLNDGLVELVTFNTPTEKIRFSDIFRIGKTFLFGLNAIKKSKNVTYRQLSSFVIKTKDETPINLDGEKSTHGTFTFNCINRGVKIIVPNKKIFMENADEKTKEN